MIQASILVPVRPGRLPSSVMSGSFAHCSPPPGCWSVCAQSGCGCLSPRPLVCGSSMRTNWDRKAIPALIQCLTDENGTVRASTVSALSAEPRPTLLTDAPLLPLPAAFTTLADPWSKYGQHDDVPFVLLCRDRRLALERQFDRGSWTMVSGAASALTSPVWTPAPDRPLSAGLIAQDTGWFSE